MKRHSLEIAPSVLAADLASLASEVRKVEAAGATLIHFDVMDGHFVPNISMGVPVLASLRKATRLPLDVHLMIERPGEFVEAFAKAGANRILVHQEATAHLDRVLTQIRDLKVEAGVAINPATPVATLSEVLDRVDTVLVMSVNPGFGGQSFIPGALSKIRELKALRSRYNTFRIEVDGGVGLENVVELVQAGAETLVAGTSIYGTADPAATFREMQSLAQEALTQKV
ncbi:MAG: ribulose-phosphate 3-epimerase [Candidatus Acidiferrales bacterium]